MKIKEYLFKLKEYYVSEGTPLELKKQRFYDNMELIEAAMGMAGELAEMIEARDTDKFLAEAGDFQHYFLRVCSMAAPSNKQVWDDHPGPQIELNLERTLIIKTGEMVDMVKKHVAYGKPIDETAFLQLVDVVWYNFCWYIAPHTSEGARIGNVEKLDARKKAGSITDVEKRK